MQKLLDQWQLIAEESIDVPVEEVSVLEYEPQKYFKANIPGTVVGHLAEAGLYSDPYYGTNMKKIPGFKHGRTDHFAFHQMPADSPFRKSFWYRTTFSIDNKERGKRFRIKIDGLNYRGNLWVNGKRVAGDDFLIGAYRRFDLDITNFVNVGNDNCVAFEIYAQRPDELGITFIDWGPVPSDDSMGIWQPVTIYTTEEVSVADLYMRGKPAGNNKAEIEAITEIRNDSDVNVEVELKLLVDGVSVEKKYLLPSKSVSEVDFLPKDFSELIIKSPRLWWPHDLGSPELYESKIELYKDGKLLEGKSVKFGIREITSYINEHGSRIFEVNGKKILIRGAAWSPDLMLKQSKIQDEVDIEYVKNMNFNTIRFEGKFGSDYIWDLCDQHGILVLAGWPCCTHWEKWDEWKAGDLTVALECLKSQLLRLRNHPSLIAWFYGSDYPPPVDVEREYLKVLSKYCNNISAISSASAFPSAVQGDTGVKMSGPYGYVPPDYWYKENMPGRANSFNTEAGPDVTIPRLSSLKKFIPENELEIGSASWKFHCGLASFPDTSCNDNAIENRYGKEKDLDDHNLKAQVLSYEVWRAAFESYGSSYPVGTGFIGWMLNSGWPSMIWQLYDYYNKPVGGFWGAKKACEPIHVQYDYVDNSLKLCNYGNFIKDIDITLKYSIYNFAGDVIDSAEAVEKLPSYGSVKSLKLNEQKEPLFLFIEWAGEDISEGRNCYWLPYEKDVYVEKNSRKTWFTWPLTKHADLSSLQNLDECEVKNKIEIEEKDNQSIIRITFENRDDKIAFFIEAESEYLIFWKENCITLKPNEKRTIEGVVKDRYNKNKISVNDIYFSAWNCRFIKES